MRRNFFPFFCCCCISGNWSRCCWKSSCWDVVVSSTELGNGKCADGSRGVLRTGTTEADFHLAVFFLLLTLTPPLRLLKLFEWVLDHRRRLDLGRRRCGDRRVHPVVVVVILVANINTFLPTLIIKSLRQATLPNLKRSPRSLPRGIRTHRILLHIEIRAPRSTSTTRIGRSWRWPCTVACIEERLCHCRCRCSHPCPYRLVRK